MFDNYIRESYIFNAGSLGYIEGLTITSHGSPAVHYFGGLPYALPPTEQWRFRVPRRLPKDYRYGTATEPGKFTDETRICPQPPSSNTPHPSVVNEDCLQLNIWVPAGPHPKDGWPVCFYIHGGFLQVGTSNTKPEDLVSLLSESAFRAIMVLPSYRLNVFGFLASRELFAEASSNGEATGNYGLWDQRMALEWTHENISFFGGDPANITVAGYSAGAYSSFQQLAHELFRVPEEKAIIRRVAMFSNSTGVRPKGLQDQQPQFDELLTRLGINLALSDEEKLTSLRAVPHYNLVQVQNGMRISEFRVLADDAFYPADLIDRINNGEFARKMKDRGITLINGECESEHTMYRRWRTPQESYSAVYQRFSAEFAPEVTKKIMEHYCGPSQKLPTEYANWEDFFGRIYANIQVHYLQRGFHNALFAGGLEAGKDVFRYRFERRLDCVAEKIPAEWGVTHLTDVPIWLWGCGYEGGLSVQEKEWLKDWNEGFAAFVKGDEVNWGTSRPKDMRRWRSDGETDIWEDSSWEHGVEFWKLVNSGHKGTERNANYQEHDSQP
ncbi:putative esterase/lipase [Fusarium oxysporum f. sp. rapae]|uniref:Carboxylic ester hydrolase n=1 Tax=Fusarium oxysporum f. sp. rapae TaxID=485398 RepID=A0A8J5UF30_FUSOX|nr:putative esterase/lipase [Fusarium oxysporum f. sp. rapae]